MIRLSEWDLAQSLVLAFSAKLYEGMKVLTIWPLYVEDRGCEKCAALDPHGLMPLQRCEGP